PPLSFIVDTDTNDDLVDALGRALNAGAIVFVNEKGEDLLLSSLKGKRFRLSYILAPHYTLPLMLGKARSLDSILKGRVIRSDNKNRSEPLFDQKDVDG